MNSHLVDFSLVDTDELLNQMPASKTVEFIWHKLFDNPSATYTESDSVYNTWSYPDCWKLRFYLNYILNKQYIEDKTILEIGSNLNFYSVCSIIAGANAVHAIEGDTMRFQLGHEFIELHQLSNLIKTKNMSVDLLVQHYNTLNLPKIDTVVFQDVLYYLHDHINILKFISDVVNPTYLFLESTVSEIEIRDHGHLELWLPSTGSQDIEAIKDGDNNNPLAYKPSRNALRSIIDYTGWEVLFYYDYLDFKGRGESPPRRNGRKDYYVLLNKNKKHAK